MKQSSAGGDQHDHDAGNAGRPNRHIWDLLTVSLILLGLLAACEQIWNYDIFWHLTAGQWMLRHGGLLHQDFWSTGGPKPLLNVYWFFQILLTGLYSIGGFPALSALKMVILGAIAFVLARAVRTPSRPIASAFLLAMTLMIVQTRVRARPEAFTLLNLTLVIWILESTRRGDSRQRLWLLLPVMIVWVNMHSLFVLGLVLVWLAFLGGWFDQRFRQRGFTHPDHVGSPAKVRAGQQLALATLGCLVNPDPLNTIVHPFRLWSQARGAIPEYAFGFGELGATWRNLGEPEVILTLVLVVLALAGILRRLHRTPTAHLLWLATATYLGATAVRNVGIAALVAGYLAAVHLPAAGRLATSTHPQSRTPRLAFGATLLILAVGVAYVTGLVGRVDQRTARPGLGLQRDLYPIATAKMIGTMPEPGDILPLNFGDAGAFIFYANPDRADPTTIGHKVYIDGRSDLHSREEYAYLYDIRTAIASSVSAAESVPLPTEVRYILADFYDIEVIANLHASPRFKLLLLDHAHICFERTDMKPLAHKSSDTLREYDRVLPVGPVGPILEPPKRYRRLWYKQHPLETHWRLGVVLAFLDREDLAVRYLESAEALDVGSRRNRRGILAMALAKSRETRGGQVGIPYSTDLPIDTFASRALWLLDRPGVRDLHDWHGQTYDHQMIQLLWRTEQYDVASRAIAAHLAHPAVAGMNAPDPDLVELQNRIDLGLREQLAAVWRLELDRLSPAARVLALARLGLPEKAIAEFGASDNPDVLVVLGDLELRLGRVEEARRFYSAAYAEQAAARQTRPDLSVRLALCDWVEGDITDALERLEAVAREASEQPTARYYLALLLKMIGRYDEAGAALLDIAHADRPSDTSLQTAVGRLAEELSVEP